MNGWVATFCMLDSPDGPEAVAGWRYGHLFIDFRPVIGDHEVPFCWMVSHVDTGKGLVALLTGLNMARGRVEELAALTDWSRTESGVAPRFFRDWLDRLPCAWCGAAATITPFSTVHHRPALRVVQ